jgi:hypothetical protein
MKFHQPPAVRLDMEAGVRVEGGGGGGHCSSSRLGWFAVSGGC